MEKQKVKVVKLKTGKEVSYDKKSYNPKNEIIQLIIKLVINAIVLMIVAAIFPSVIINGFWYAVIASVIISLLNQFLRPFLVIATLSLTFGILYPFINVMILKITAFLLGSNFVMPGFFVPIIVSYCISSLNYFLETLIIGEK